jgi:hypothetical protein
MSMGGRSSAIAFVTLCAAFVLVLAACKREDAARTRATQSTTASEIPTPSAASPPNADSASEIATTSAASPPNADSALSLVNRFIVAESTGNWWAAHSLVAWRYCHWDPATDFLKVTTAIQVRGTGPVGDSALVQVIYDVVGRVWLGDPPLVGTQRTRFAAEGSSDTVTYRVFADSTGRQWLACGDFHQNHVGVSQLHEFVKRFEDSSLASWNAVLPSARP